MPEDTPITPDEETTTPAEPIEEVDPGVENPQADDNIDKDGEDEGI